MKNWKAPLLIILLLGSLLLYSFYIILDQSVTITYMQEGYSDTEKDLETLCDIIEKTNLSKEEIQNELKKQSDFELYTLDSDTFYLNRLSLIFTNDKLSKLNTQW